MEASPSPERPTSILFVCLGNICRSPLAEGVFKHLAEQKGLADRFHVESAGTGSWHVGEEADARSQRVARDNGITLDSRARQVEPGDLERFDHVVAMDRDNLRTLERMRDAQGGTRRIRLLRDFDPEADGDEVPDPYYGGPGGFDDVFEMVRRSCEGLLEDVEAARTAD
jgi:protein-tyrosine phosphatase